MHKYKTMQEFRCASGRRFSRAGVRENLPELCVIFTVKWLVSVAVNVQLCCMFLLGIDDVIYHFRVALGTDMRQQHWRKLSCLTGKWRDNLGAIFYLQACLYQPSFFSVIFLCHISTSLSSTWRCQKAVEIHVDFMKSMGKPSMSQAKVPNGRELAGALGCSACQWAENYL